MYCVYVIHIFFQQPKGNLSMFKLNKEYETLVEQVNLVNKRLGMVRFYPMFNQTKRFVTVGLYDSKTKQYELFDSVNFAGNFRYDKNTKPSEFFRMEAMLKAA